MIAADMTPLPLSKDNQWARCRVRTATSGGAAAAKIASYSRDGMLRLTIPRSPGEWVRAEIPANVPASESAANLTVRLAIEGRPGAVIDAVYLICRPDNGAEQAFELKTKFSLTGSIDTIFTSVKVADPRPSGIWWVCLQVSKELELSIHELNVQAASAPTAARSLGINGSPKATLANKANRAVIVCVHNSIDVTVPCIRGALTGLSAGDVLVVVDDGSTPAVSAALLELIGGRQDCLYVGDETASGYTKAVNRGIQHAEAEYYVLLNSDTLVPSEWLDRLCASFGQADPKIGVVGPLSNRATLQSVPLIEYNGAWANNSVIEPVNAWLADLTVKECAERLGIPNLRIPLVNGFCMAVARQVFESVGLFDESVFAEGYGEETDFQLRAAAHGFGCVVNPSLFVYHHGSASYEPTEFDSLQSSALEAVRLKHGEQTVSRAYAQSREIMLNFPNRSTLAAMLQSVPLLAEAASKRLAGGSALGPLDRRWFDNLFDVLLDRTEVAQLRPSRAAGPRPARSEPESEQL